MAYIRDGGLNGQSRTVEIAREQVARVLCEGDSAVDATGGNGCDTLGLSRRVGPAGRVPDLDILRVSSLQPGAEGVVRRVTSWKASHER